MTFLSPIPAIVAASLAVPLLVLFYLLKLRRRPVRVGSTMFWTEQRRDLQANVPLRMIRPSWLFFLQLLGLALLLLALARPAMNVRGAPPSKVILVIDRSASMSVVEGEGEAGESRLARARRAALDELDRIGRAGRGTSVMIVSLSARAEAATPLTSDLFAARRAVEALTPTHQPGNIDAAISLIGAIVSDSRATDEAAGTPEPAEVVLISDGSFSSGAGGSIAGARTRYVRIGPPGAPPDAVARSDNAGIVALAARRDYEDPATVLVFARLLNAFDRDVDLPVFLHLNGEVIERRPVSLPGAERADGGVTASPIELSFELATREGGVITLELRREDALEADDAASLVFSPVAATAIALVSPDDSSPADRFAGRILAEVLRELADGGFRSLSKSEYAAALAGGSLPPVDLFVFDRVRPPRPPPAPSLSIGAPLPFDPSLDPPTDVRTSPTYALSWRREHPVLRDVALDTLFVEHTLPLIPGGNEDASPVPLAVGRDGALIALDEADDVRRLAIGFELARSSWPAEPTSFAVFLANTIDYLTLRGDAEVGRSFTTSEPIRLDLDPPGEVRLVGPARAAETRTIPLRRVGGTASGGPVPIAGLYDVLVNEEPAAQVAVNLHDETETLARSMPALGIGGREAASGMEATAPRELWPWFVLAALVVLSLEWVLSAWLSRV